VARKVSILRSGEDLWQKHVRIYYGIFLLALEKLPLATMRDKSESDISEQLFLNLQEVCREEIKRNSDVRDPDWEKPIPPEQLTGKPNAAKKPDFTCTIFNPDYFETEDYRKDLHIECKRLNAEKRAGSLTQKYVTEGIQRFDAATHKYGKNVNTGFMIGYIVSDNSAEILKAVNQHLHGKSKGDSLTAVEIKNSVTVYNQNMHRKTVIPSEFNLIHFWKDSVAT